MNNLQLLVLLFVFQLFEFLYTTKILQNQYYSFKRLLMYEKSVLKTLYKIVLTFVSFFLLKYNRIFILMLALMFTHKRKNMNIKITKRIIRHFICFFSLFLVNIIIINYTNSKTALYIFLFYNLLLYYFSFAISVFIERIIQKIYIKKAQRKLKNVNPLVIGITGSYGKTSCKKYIYELLKSRYKVLFTQESYNTLNGITKTINEHLKPYHQIVILEIGVDSKNGMNKFLKNYNFDISVLTCVGNQHLKTFKTKENIMLEKIKLINNSKLISIINNDDEYIKYVDAKNTLSFSTKEKESDIKIEQSFDEITGNKKIKIIIKGNSFSTTTNLYGDHNVSNLACAISVAYYLNIPFDDMINTIPLIKNVDHRLSIFTINHWLFIDDSYNSNYVGFKNALIELNYHKNMKVIITPGIIEQGKNMKKENEEIAKMINRICDIIILIKKPTFSNLIKNHLSFNSFKEAYTYLEENYKNQELTILIENDVPEVFLR